MLSKYNLYVGYIVNSDGDYDVFEIEDPTGIQDEITVGSDGYFIGAVDFTDTGGVYAGSTVEYYVRNYGSYLSSLGLKNFNSRLITKDELESLGCEQWVSYSCDSAPSWVYSTAYWSGTDDGGGYLWGVDSNGSYGEAIYEYLNDRGVRPVIEVASGEVIDLLTFTINGILYYASEGMTWEEWIESDYNTLSLVCDSNGYVSTETGNRILNDNVEVLSTNKVITNGEYAYSMHSSGGSVE